MPPGYEILRFGARKIFKMQAEYSEHPCSPPHLQSLQNKRKPSYNYVYKTSHLQNLA